MSTHSIPTEFVAQVAVGGTMGGIAATFANPAFAPLWGAIAALVVALIQYAIRRVEKKAPDATVNKEIQETLTLALVEAMKAMRSHSTPPPAIVPPPGAGLVLLLALGLGLSSCQSWTTADYARTTLEAVAQASIAGGESVVSAYCNAQLIAAGYPRGGRVTNGHCAPVGDGVQLHVATPAQVAAVESVRVQWRTVALAWEGVVTAHTVAAGLLGRGDTQNLLPAIGQVSTAYTALQIAAADLGVQVPPPLIAVGGESVRADSSLPPARD